MAVTVQPYPMGMPVMPMVNTVVDRAPGKKTWDHSLCDCCSDPILCIGGMCCPLCLFFKNVSDLGESICCYGIMTCCGFPMGIAVRAAARERYSILGSHDEDVLVGICFNICSQCQIAHEIKMANIRGQGGLIRY